MKVASLSTEYKERKNYIEVMVFHDYCFTKGTRVYNGTKTSVIKIKKATQAEIIKETKKL